MRAKRVNEPERHANAHILRRPGKDDVHEQRESDQGQEGALSAQAAQDADVPASEHKGRPPFEPGSGRRHPPRR